MESCYTLALKALEERRLENRNIGDARHKGVESKAPEIREIEEKVHQQVRMPKKVKPGYKKKRKAEIDKKIRKAKREYIAEIYKRIK